MSAQYFDANGTLRQFWNYLTRIYMEWDETGEEILSRPFTLEENASADVSNSHAESVEADNWQTKAAGALVEAQLAMAPQPTTGQLWVQPLGAHDAYAEESLVTWNSKTWVSLTPFNVWEPGVSGWREVVSEGFPAWVRPTGAHDAYPMNARVSHGGQNWENTGSASNIWEPGVYGWIIIP